MPTGAGAAGPLSGPAQPLAAGQQRWRLLLAYDGAPFRGFAAQPGLPTVAGALAEALARSLRLPRAPTLVCAGRTDAGVHARGQVVHVDLPEGALVEGPSATPAATTDPEPSPAGGEAGSAGRLLQSLNGQLHPAIVVRRLEPAPPGFDARRSARSRRYRYLVWNAPSPDPLLAPLSWHLAVPLDLRRLRAAADTFLGEHDFRGFCRRPPGTSPGDPIVRQVHHVAWLVDTGAEAADATGAAGGPTGACSAEGRLLRFEIEASSFCHQMVRSIVALLVEAGAGRATAAAVVEALRAQGRPSRPTPAPPWGLCLTGVRYGAGMEW